MTTFSYTIALNDSELLVVREALTRYRSICESEVAGDPRSRYAYDLHSVDALLDRLYENPRMTSTSSFRFGKDKQS